MARSIALFLLLCVLTATSSSADHLNDPTVAADDRFTLFKNKYGKTYATKEEHDYRLSVFKSNLDTAWLFPYFLDQFADLTSREFLRRLPYPIDENLFLLESHTALALSCVNAYSREVLMGANVGHTCSSLLKHDHPFLFGDDKDGYVPNESKEKEKLYANSPGPNGPEGYHYQKFIQINTVPHVTTSYEMK